MEIDLLGELPGKLLEFKVSKGVPTEPKPLEIKRNDKTSFCSHPKFYLHEHSRLVECQECGKMLDSFDALMSMAKGFVKLDYRLDEHRDYHDKVNGYRFDDTFKEQQSWIRIRPEDQQGAKAWDAFATYYGTQEIKIKKQRRAAGGWCGSKIKYHGWTSLEYVISKLVSSGSMKPSIVSKSEVRDA